MRKRTQSREYALQLLYRLELNPEPIEESLASFWEGNAESDAEVRTFTERLVRETVSNLETINPLIETAMEHWDLTRVVLIDKLIMQLAVAEFFHLKDIPPKVTLNEAVNLAKKFSQEDSGKFVNGVLDRISHGQKLFQEGSDGTSGG
jgi:transcription antitermination factor NusB